MASLGEREVLLQAASALVTDTSVNPARLRSVVADCHEGGSAVDQVRHVAARLGLDVDVYELAPRFVEGAMHLGRFLAWSPLHQSFVELEPTPGRTTKARVLAARQNRPVELGSGQVAEFLGVEPSTQIQVVHARQARPLEALAHQGPSPWKRLWPLLRKERKDLWLAFVYAVGIGVLTLATPIAVQSLFNTVAFGTVTQPVVVLGVLLALALGASALLKSFEHVVLEWIGRRIFVQSATDFGNRAARMDPQLRRSVHLPELFNRFFDVVIVEKSIVKLVFDGLSSGLQILVALGLLAIYHPFLLAFSAFLLVALAFITFVMGRGAIGSAIYESKAKYKVADWIENVASTPSAFRSHTGQAFAWEKTEGFIHQWMDSRHAHFKVEMRQVVGMLMLQALTTVLLLMVGGLLVIEGQLTLGQLVAAEILMAITVSSLAKMRTLYRTTYDLLASLDKYGNILDKPLSPTRDVALRRQGDGMALEVRTTGVTVLASPGDKHAAPAHRFGDAELLVDRILGSVSDPSIEVKLDGHAVDDLDQATIGDQVMVLRTEELFGGTVRENLTLGRASERTDRLWEVLGLVGLEDRLRRLEHGLETPVLPTGRPFTLDERIRLLVARALIMKPRLLVLPQTLDLLNRRQRRSMMDLLCDASLGWTVLVLTEQSDVLDGLYNMPVKEVV